MKTDGIGLYVHTPLCVKKCNYCDFCSFSAGEASWREEYINTLCREIMSYSERSIKIDTVFFGGGTPSLLTPREFDKICSAIDKSFSLSPEVEFTIEANPKTLTRENLSSYISCGVNRISMGLQSIRENELKILGRIHDFADFLESYSLVRECGIDNINIDLMYGIPEQTRTSFSETIKTVTSLSPEHISLYGLILEPGTPFYQDRESLPIPSEDEECAMYYLAIEELCNLGYSHYEISNYAKPGRECKHNLKYWENKEYVGVGVSAYSYFDGERYGNSSSIREYLSPEREKYVSREKITQSDKAYEYVMLGLRLRQGISQIEYKKLFNSDFVNEQRQTKLQELSMLGYLTMTDDRIALTDKGFYISNKILTDLI